MDVKEYISSGAIEACITGLADEQDWNELLQMAEQYPEVRAYKEKLELEQEADHLQQAAKVPPGLKDKIFAELETGDKKSQAPVVTMPATGSNGKPMSVPIIPTPKPMKWLQRAVAVSVILLMGSIILNFYFYSKSVSYHNQYKALFASQSSLVAQNKAMQASFKMIKDPAVKQVVMNATPHFTGSMATVFWDSRSKDVYLMVNQLPKPAAEKQYQLWAIVNGKPVDAGMLELNGDEGTALHKMHNIPQAEAFAITLEKKGGSAVPTMDALYVIGKV